MSSGIDNGMVQEFWTCLTSFQQQIKVDMSMFLKYPYIDRISQSPSPTPKKPRMVTRQAYKILKFTQNKTPPLEFDFIHLYIWQNVDL